MLTPALVVFLIAAAATVLYFVLFRGGEPEAISDIADKQVPGEPEPVPAGSKIDYIEVELEESDDLVRKLAGELSSHPTLARWLLSRHLIRNFVAAVDNIAAGQSPRRQIDFFQPGRDFRVVEKDGLYYPDPGTFRRYDLVAEVFASIDTGGSVTLYRQLTPAMREAYRELGYPEGNFHETLQRAIAELLAVPVVEERIRLELEVITYRMVDPALEGLSPAQKHLLRMGPGNVRSIQTKLREISLHPDFHAAALQ